jgi:hypothetical protein
MSEGNKKCIKNSGLKLEGRRWLGRQTQIEG